MKFLKMMLAALLLSAAGAGFAATPNTSPVERELPLVTVHKSPYCGCCKLWVDHMRAEGFEVKVVEVEDLGPVKARVGIPPAKGSCHTAEVDGYVIEGHVPAADIRRLLREKPPIRGLVLPGMPVGSPGMEVEGVDAPSYTVLALHRDGSTTPYAEHSP